MSVTMVVKTIKLTSLFVNTENYRFEPLSSQKEAIDKMVEDQGDKLYSLVEFKNKKGESVRKDAKFDKQYLEGKYGADPVSYTHLTLPTIA